MGGSIKNAWKYEYMRPLIIFADRHHSGLYYSLHLLFERRLGHELYCPVGMDWADSGYWLIHKPYNFNIDTAKQFLCDGFKPSDGTPPITNVVNSNQDFCEIKDDVHNFDIKGITFEQFKRLEIDIILPSIPDHYESFKTLGNTYKPHARVLCQLGNIDWHELPIIKQGGIKNLMASVKPFNTNISNVCFYHQEMRVREYAQPPQSPAIRSFVNLLPERALYESYKRDLSPILLEAYGAGTPQGMISGIDKLYDSIQSSSMVYHVKPHGDGFGHVIYSAFMLGRPVITRFSDYKDKLASELLIDNVTAIDLDSRSYDQSLIDIRQIVSNRERLMEMCQEAYRIFNEKVDYKREALEVSHLLGRIV